MTMPNGKTVNFGFCGQGTPPVTSTQSAPKKPIPYNGNSEKQAPKRENPLVNLTNSNYESFKRCAFDSTPLDNKPSCYLPQVQSLFGAGEVIEKPGPGLVRYRWKEGNREITCSFKDQGLMKWESQGFN